MIMVQNQAEGPTKTKARAVMDMNRDTSTQYLLGSAVSIAVTAKQVDTNFQASVREQDIEPAE
jgi:MoxR-like ATPase